MNKIYVLLLLFSLSILVGVECNFNDYTEFGETTGFPSASNVFMSQDNYIINRVHKGLSILRSEPDGSLTLVDTLVTSDIGSAIIKDNYLALSCHSLSKIILYDCEDMENIQYTHSIESNQHVMSMNIIDVDRIVVNSTMYSLSSGEVLNIYEDYLFINDSLIDSGMLLAYDMSNWKQKWGYFNLQNQFVIEKTQNGLIDYAKIYNDEFYTAEDSYIKRYESFYDEVALDSIYVDWYDMYFCKRGFDLKDNKLYFIDADINPISQMDEPLLKTYDIIENQFQFHSEKFFFENWDNRGTFLTQKAILCNNRVYINAEEEGIKGYELLNNEFQQISQYGDIAYWESSFLIHDNKIYLNARKQDRECFIYDLTNGNAPTIVENSFSFGEYHKFPYQTEYLYKKSYIDSEIEFYHVESDDMLMLIGSIPKEFFHLSFHFVPLMLTENYFVCQSYNDVLIGSFNDGVYQEYYRFNLGSNSSERKFVAFMKNDYLYSLPASGNVIDIYAIEENDYYLVSTVDSYNFNVDQYCPIVHLSEKYITFRGENEYNYLMKFDSDSYDIIEMYGLDRTDNILNNIDNYFFMHKTPDNINSRILEIKKLNPDSNPLFELIETIRFSSTIKSIDFIQENENVYNMIVTTAGSLFYYQCAVTPNGDLEITPVTLNATNYPNPFNPETTISYDIAQKGSVTVDIYNLKGQKVKSLVNENQEAGKHSIIWRGDNNQGKQVSSGTYFYRIKSAGQEVVKKMLLMK